MKYKVIATSNFGDETYCEREISRHETKEAAQAAADELNKDCTDYSPTWHRVVDANYRLWRGMADLVGDTEE